MGKVRPREVSHVPSRLPARSPVAGDTQKPLQLASRHPTTPPTRYHIPGHHWHASWQWALTNESSSTSGVEAWGLSMVGLGDTDEGAGEAGAQGGVSPLSRAGKAARPTSSSVMLSRVLVSAARRASFSLSIIWVEQREDTVSSWAQPSSRWQPVLYMQPHHHHTPAKLTQILPPPHLLSFVAVADALEMCY